MLGRIAVHLNNDNNCERRIDVALKLAAQHEAQIVGIYPNEAISGTSFTDNVVPQDMRTELNARATKFREKTIELFTNKASEAGIKFEVRNPRGGQEEALALHARFCDLLVMSKADRSDSGGTMLLNLPESVVMAAGRPVLMVPVVGNINSIGERILYCWDQKREAARAFNDARPFLGLCKELHILEVNQNISHMEKSDIQPNDFANYCISLGYTKPNIHIKTTDNIGVGHIILNTAADNACDLIVMGAYGHSRMRQWIMGGATRTLMSTMTTPVLLSH